MTPLLAPLLLLLLSSAYGQHQQPIKVGTLQSFLEPNVDASLLDQLNSEQSAQRLRLLDSTSARQGIATITYIREVVDGMEMACGFGYLNDYFRDHFISVSQTAFGPAAQACGYCVKIFCVDTICQQAFKNSTFMIADSCQACKGNDIVISAPGLKELSGVDYDNNPSIQIAYEPTSCAPYIEGGIKMLPSDEISKKFLALNFSNSKVPITAVRINGIVMTAVNYGYWVIDQRPSNQDILIRAPYTLEFIGANKQILAARTNALTAQDLKVNFNA